MTQLQKQDTQLSTAKRVLMEALAEIDLKGTNEDVSRAMSISFEVLSAFEQGKLITGQEGFKLGMRACRKKRNLG